MDNKRSEKSSSFSRKEQPSVTAHSGNSTAPDQSQQQHSNVPRKDFKREKANSRHSHHHQQQQSANSGPHKASANGSHPPGKGSANSNYSFNKHPNNYEVDLPPLEKGATVQRQRSCVANLYSGQGRNSSATMPAATACTRTKPAMQLYRPPTLRVSDDLTMSNGTSFFDANNGLDSPAKPGLNINAKEFVSLTSSSSGNSGVINGGPTVSFSGPNGMSASALKHSKSFGQVTTSSGRSVSTSSVAGGGLHHSKSGGHIIGGMRGGTGKENRHGGATGTSPPLRVHFTDDTIAYDPDNKVGMIQRSPTGNNASYYVAATGSGAIAIKRSKSLGSAADLSSHHASNGGGGGLLVAAGDSVTSTNATNAIADMAPFSEDVNQKFHQVLQSPNSATARVVMEVVTNLFNKLTQGTKYAEPASRYCIAIIEKENDSETFLETLLNTCQEYYQERDRLLRTAPSSSARGRPGALPVTQTKWVAYMTFLHEMYTRVKRRQRTVVSSTGPGLLLLTLLAECCVVSLEDQVSGGASMAQTECLFFILTGIGRDIELELPPMMAKVMGAARDALLASSKAPAVKKTLLQLIEMNAASWQLPAQAVMYYYPGVGGK